MHSDRFHLAAGPAPATFQGVNWKFQLKRLFRTIQINLPFLQDLRFTIQRAIREMTNTPAESDFEALRLIPGMDDALAIDIGANRGDTIQAICMRTRNTKVIGFEPNPLVFSRLHRIYKRNPKVKLFNFGLSNTDEIVTLNVPFYKNFMFDGLASFDVESALGWLKGRIFFYSDKLLRLRKIDCCLTPLDTLELAPAFIKIDVQGFEYQVLCGAVNTIRRSRPAILIETPSSQVVSLMKKLNYQPFRYDGKSLLPGFGSLNTFFLDESRLPRAV